jgi:hypothetical protein
MDTVKFGLRTCPKCGEQFIIRNNMPWMLDDGLKKTECVGKANKERTKIWQAANAQAV